MHLIFSKKRDNLLGIALVSSTILAIIFLVIVKNHSDSNNAYQSQIMQQSVADASHKVGLQIDGLKNALNLFAHNYHDDFVKLSASNQSEDVYLKILAPLSQYFHEYYAFTLADENGIVVYDDFGEKIGHLCLLDIKNFAETGVNDGIYIHPGPSGYHFDIMLEWLMPNGKKGIFFVSFVPEVLAAILKDSEVAGHQLYLTQKDKPTFIELSAVGSRDKLSREFDLSNEEFQRIQFKMDIPKTRWQVVDIPAPELAAHSLSGYEKNLLFVIVSFLAINMLLFTMAKKSARNRLIAENSLLELNKSLERKVIDRTYDLVEKNKLLNNEINERYLVEEKLSHQASHDTLTGLPNRNLMYERLSQARDRTELSGQIVAVLFLDIDNFKLINDSLGHSLGDRVLQDAVKVILTCMRKEDTLARFGGDEFVLILESITDAAGAAKIANKILDSISQPLSIDGLQIRLTLSIGITLFPEDAEGNERLLSNADMAMYRAKRRGSNNYEFFTEEMTLDAKRRQTLGAALLHALQRREFTLLYQPKVSFQSEKIVGVEALLRWNNPSLGNVSPQEFIPILEETGLIVEVGEWVIQQACDFIYQRYIDDKPPIFVSVNISLCQFYNKDFPGQVKRIISSAPLNIQYLEFEITESMLADTFVDTLAILNTFKDLGVRLAIDDFGTGYSSLNYLLKFPIDTLKIDASFVIGLSDEEKNKEIISTIIAMSNRLNMTCVAEGVETIEHVEFLKSQGCNLGQGYYFSPAITVAQLGEITEEFAV